MQNLKIKVNTVEESKEAQELLEFLGINTGIKILSDYIYADFLEMEAYNHVLNPDEYRKITLAELRDMVILRRNDVADATHEYVDDAEFKYRLINNQWHVITSGNPVWRKSSITLKESPLFMKPIEKKDMKEYINKTTGEYRKTAEKVIGEQWLEIPEGANFYCDYFWLQLNSRKFWDGCSWQDDENTLLKYSKTFTRSITWQRPAQPEALPFIDDEPQSLNNQYYEIEQVRQHKHYFKDVSNLDEIDVYMVLKLFNVTDPCLQHIVKKALCAGQRGHKDLERDLKDILDTAKRAVDINKTY